MLYFSDVSDVLLQSIFKLNDDEKLSTSITISESQLVITVKFNPMIKKKSFHFYVKTRMLADFQICISVPLTPSRLQKRPQMAIIDYV